eukprot:s1569_g9.t1
MFWAPGLVRYRLGRRRRQYRCTGDLDAGFGSNSRTYGLAGDFAAAWTASLEAACNEELRKYLAMAYWQHCGDRSSRCLRFCVPEWQLPPGVGHLKTNPAGPSRQDT